MNYRDFLASAHVSRNRDSGETGPRSPPYLDWSRRNKRGSRQGISPHLRDRPFVGIGWPLSFLVLSGPLSIFLPLFFPPQALHLPLYGGVGPLFLFGPTLQHIGALASLWVGRPVRRLRHYYHRHPRFYFYTTAVITVINVVYDKEASVSPRTLRFIAIYLSRTLHLFFPLLRGLRWETSGYVFGATEDTRDASREYVTAIFSSFRFCNQQNAP